MWDNVKGWISQPFTSDMDLWKWFLFLVVMITIAVLWLQILNAIGVE